MMYEPKEDSFLLKEQVKKYAKNKTVLDIGSGSGIQAETAIKSGAKNVLATDIKDYIIKYLKNKSIKAIRSNLFSALKNKKFDLIIFNPPYLPEDKREDRKSKVSTTGGKRGDEIILRFLKQAPKYLNKNGKIFLVISSLTPQQRINKLLEKQKLKRIIIAEQKFFFEKLEVLEISKVD